MVSRLILYNDRGARFSVLAGTLVSAVRAQPEGRAGTLKRAPLPAIVKYYKGHHTRVAVAVISLAAMVDAESPGLRQGL